MAKVGFGLAESQTCFLIGYQWQPIEIPSKADFTKLAQTYVAMISTFLRNRSDSQYEM